MAGFIRRYTTDPGIEEITAIEGCIIIDREPAATLTGLGAGTVNLVGEFEDGCFDESVEVMSGSDLLTQYGGLGYTYDGLVSCNPCARSRRADSAVVPEYWNGNGFISLVSKKFRRLFITRVDTTVGEVEFTRRASVEGNTNFNWDLDTGDWVEVDINRNGASATVATLNSPVGTSPTVFAGGETMTVTVDAGTPRQQAVTITMTAGSKTQAQAIAMLNAAFGEILVSNASAGVTRIVSRVKGTLGNVTITSIHATFTTLLGFVALATAAGTGTSPYWATFTGVVATYTGGAPTFPLVLVGGESFGLTIDAGLVTERTATVALLSTDTTNVLVRNRINAAIGYSCCSIAGTGELVFVGLTPGTGGSVRISALHPTLAVGLNIAEGITMGTGNVANINQVTFAEAKTVIEAAGTPNLAVERGYGNELRVANNTLTGTTITIQVTRGTAATKFGFDTAVEGNALVGTQTSIPAGARVRTAGGAEWVVARTVPVLADDTGPYVARLRPATDDGTGVGAGVGTVNVIPFPFGTDSWAVVNTSAVNAALSEAAIDAAYVAAIDSTINANSVAKETNIIVSARQSNAVRQRLRQNAPTASDEGLRGRITVVSPPLGTTTRAMARSATSQPGVGAYRHDRLTYAYPGAQTYVPQIATRGLAGGVGFTADGLIDVHFDTWIASACSQLNPEENPGQLTDYMLGIRGIEAGNPDVQNMGIGDYRAFKAAGIAALRMDEGVAIIQSGKTSVNPTTQPNLVNISRRRMADMIQDTLALRLNKISKKLATKVRRAACLGEIGAFLAGLQSKTNPASQRIDSYLVDGLSGNTPDTLAVGIYRIKIKVRLLASMDFIVLDTEIGESVVTVAEAA